MEDLSGLGCAEEQPLVSPQVRRLGGEKDQPTQLLGGGRVLLNDGNRNLFGALDTKPQPEREQQGDEELPGVSLLKPPRDDQNRSLLP
ncbi:MAG: hypothetical protein ACI8RZ_002964 [Myxococcota bacterium]|jgi:hypothetical protein